MSLLFEKCEFSFSLDFCVVFEYSTLLFNFATLGDRILSVIRSQRDTKNCKARNMAVQGIKNRTN